MQPAPTQSWTPTEPDVMELDGRFDSDAATAIEEDCLLCIESGARRMVLDCHNLFYMTAAGLRCLLALARAMEMAGGRLIVCDLPPQVEEIFLAAGFDVFIPIYGSRGDAFAALAA